MGYDLHITRRDFWFEDGAEIGFEEWRDYVAGDPELHLDGFAETGTSDGNTIRIESPGLTSWRPNGDVIGWFNHRRGVVTTKSPDPQIFAKMWQIATALGARIQGDEGEFYNAAFEPMPVDAGSPEPTPPPPPPPTGLFERAKRALR